jgi:hypothetical protein
VWLSEHLELAPEGDWLTHYRLRLAYENQMIEAQGGRAAFVEMQVGGWIGDSQIRKIVKSNATGRVTSVEIMGTVHRYVFDKASGQSVERVTKGPKLINIERCSADLYRAPTPEDIAAMEAIKKAEKAARPKVATIPLVNPTDADADRLVEILNQRRRAEFDRQHGTSAKYYEFKPCAVERITQAVYSANSKGAYSKAETRNLCADGQLADRESNLWSRHIEERRKRLGSALCQIRVAGYESVRILILTDKPQKPLPESVWLPYVPEETPEAVTA